MISRANRYQALPLRFWGEPGYEAGQLLFWMIVALCDCYVSSPKWLELKVVLLTATILLICICSYLSSSVWMLCSWVPPGEVLVTPLQTSLTSRPWSPWMDILSLIDLCSLSPQIWLEIEWLMKILTVNYGCGWLQYHEKSIIPRLAPNLDKYFLFVLSQCYCILLACCTPEVIYMFQFSKFACFSFSKFACFSFSNVENCL